MKGKIVLIAFVLLSIGLFIVCSDTINNCHYNYLSSEDSKTTLTLIQYNNPDEFETRGIYVVYGRKAKDGVLPTRNYFKIDYDTDPLWIKWGNDGKVRILYGMGKIIENHLESDTLQIFHYRTKEDFDRLVNGENEKYKRFIISRLKYW
jgi:hypothetical protein